MKKKFSPIEQDIISACVGCAKTPSQLFKEWGGRYTYQYIQSTMSRLKMIGILGSGGNTRKGVYYRVLNKDDPLIKDIIVDREIDIVKQTIYSDASVV